MKEKLKQNNQLAKTFSYTFRYIDDLLAVNNPNFENEIGNIYPPQLELKKPHRKWKQALVFRFRAKHVTLGFVSWPLQFM